MENGIYFLRCPRLCQIKATQQRGQVRGLVPWRWKRAHEGKYCIHLQLGRDRLLLRQNLPTHRYNQLDFRLCQRWARDCHRGWRLHERTNSWSDCRWCSMLGLRHNWNNNHVRNWHKNSAGATTRLCWRTRPRQIVWRPTDTFDGCWDR